MNDDGEADVRLLGPDGDLETLVTVTELHSGTNASADRVVDALLDEFDRGDVTVELK